MNRKRDGITATLGLVALGTLCALIPVRSRAEPAADAWQWGATIYLWLPSLGGETSFPPDGGGPSIDVTADQILDSLNFVFMAAVDGRKGPWGLATDVVYIDLGATKQSTRDFRLGQVDIPGSVTAKLGLDVTGWLWTLSGSYAVVERDDHSLHALAGARLLVLEESLDWTLNGDISSLPLDRSGTASDREEQWDAIVGVKGRAEFGAERRWYVPYYVDVGAGESDFTWQGMLGLGYRFDSVEVSGVWRYLDYDLGESTPIKSIDFNGPAVGVTYRF
jgi:opacity protein-like surface antigen